MTSSLPVPDSFQLIGKITKVLGGNLLECCSSGKEETWLCRIPTKLKNLFFFRPDLFILCSPEALAGDKGKVQYFVSYVLLDNQIKHLCKLGIWPSDDARFDVDKSMAAKSQTTDFQNASASAVPDLLQRPTFEEVDEDALLFENHNRRQIVESSDESDLSN